MLVPVPTGADVHAHLGFDPPDPAEIQDRLPQVVRMVAGYTRGVGFEAATFNPATGVYGGTVPDDLWAVVVAVAARTLRNPTALRSYEFSVDGDHRTAWTSAAPVGFTLPETAILHRYRRRTA